MVQLGDFGLIHIAHRGNIVRNVVEAALAMIRDFGRVGEVVQRMASVNLAPAQRLEFARRALAVRYPHAQHQPVTPEQVVVPRREADAGFNVWATYNVQENLTRGGLSGRAVTGRNTRTRTIEAIRQDVRINNGLWQLAMSMISG
jgi:hypothetical protein